MAQTAPAVVFLNETEPRVAVAVLRMSGVYSSEIFLEIAGYRGTPVVPRELSNACHERWTDWAAAIASLPYAAEVGLVLGHAGGHVDKGAGLAVGILALGRGASEREAEAACLRTYADLRTLTVTNLDYAQFDVVTDPAEARVFVELVELERVLELRRPFQELRLSDDSDFLRWFGFVPGSPADGTPRQKHEGLHLRHLFPWVPSNDPWRRILQALEAEPARSAFLVHVEGCARAPVAALETLRAGVAELERMRSGAPRAEGGQSAPFLRKLDAMLSDDVTRLAMLERPVLAARIFVASDAPPSGAFLATVQGSIDDASVSVEQANGEALFRGGAEIVSVPAREFARASAEPSLRQLFGIREVGAVLRTPMPTEHNLPGLRVNRARTAPPTGRTGDDAPLGRVESTLSNEEVRLDGAARFRHAYVIGQTGTGKSTLLLNMILHDIHKGRGVAVLDPHGSLIDDVLGHFPMSRRDDLILVDPTDVDRPVPFNLLNLREPDPARYRAQRDLLIDDLYNYLDRTYDLRTTGGPIFEAHFRNVLALLLGVEQPTDPALIPSLMLFRSIYTNKRLRERLVSRMKGRDPVLEEFLEEATNAGGDLSFQNVAPYITSKFSRFVSDVALRNITCQRGMLDFDDLVAKGKVLLFYLGKGRFGDQAAGLLASQIMSRLRYAVMKRGTSPANRPFYLYADEFQLFADGRFAELMAEARKFGLALTVAHQFVDQLPDAVMKAVLGNVGTLVAFRVGSRDADVLGPAFQPTFGPRDLVSLPNFNAYARSYGVLGQTAFSIRGLGPAANGDPKLAERLRDHARLNHGISRHIVEAEMAETLAAYREGKGKGDMIESKL